MLVASWSLTKRALRSPQLRNTKCADPTKGTLLHFLIKLIDADAKKNAAPDLWNIVPELESAAKAKRGNESICILAGP